MKNWKEKMVYVLAEDNPFSYIKEHYFLSFDDLFYFSLYYWDRWRMSSQLYIRSKNSSRNSISTLIEKFSHCVICLSSSITFRGVRYQSFREWMTFLSDIFALSRNIMMVVYHQSICFNIINTNTLFIYEDTFMTRLVKTQLI